MSGPFSVLNTQNLFYPAYGFGKKAGGFFLNLFLPTNSNGRSPYLLKNKPTIFLIMAMVLLRLAVFALVVDAEQANIGEFGLNKTSILLSINESRELQGLSELADSAILTLAAQKKADDMAQKNYFAHVSPEGKQAWDFILEAGYKYAAAGENLAVNFLSSKELDMGWMASPSHRANLLGKQYSETGIGISKGSFEGKPALFVVQMFATPMPENVLTQISSSQTFIPRGLVSGEYKQNSLIENAQIFPKNDRMEILIQTSNEAVLLKAVYNHKGFMMTPVSNIFWKVEIPQAVFLDFGHSLNIVASDIQGREQIVQAGEFYKTFNNVITGEDGQYSNSPVAKRPDKYAYQIMIIAINSVLAVALGLGGRLVEIKAVANAATISIMGSVAMMV